MITTLPTIPTHLPSSLCAEDDLWLTADQVRQGFDLSRRTSRIELVRMAKDALSGMKGFAVPENIHLFGSSTKTKKGEKFRIETIVSYLLPGKLCKHATKLCLASCLGTKSGQLALSCARNAQRWKTALLEIAPIIFVALFCKEIETLQKRTEKSGYTPAVRVDGSSDTGIGQQLASYYPDVEFYDYTKSVERAVHCAKKPIPNYDLTFSYSGENADSCRRVLASGGKVAVVFAVMPASESQNRPSALPTGDFEGYEIVDGDKHDARFRDTRKPKGIVVALSLKGSDVPFAEVVRRAGIFAVPADRRTF